MTIDEEGRMRKLVVAALVLTLGLAACGKDSKSSSTNASTGGTAASGAPVQLPGQVTDKGTKDATGATSLAVEQDDYYFKPTFIKATAGQKLTLTVKNEGKASHTFTSTELGVDKELKPGESASIDVTVPSADATLFFCRFHQSSGMQGAIYTKDGASIGGASGATPTTVQTTSNGY
jgi:plastocyanin